MYPYLSPRNLVRVLVAKYPTDQQSLEINECKMPLDVGYVLKNPSDADQSAHVKDNAAATSLRHSTKINKDFAGTRALHQGMNTVRSTSVPVLASVPSIGLVNQALGNTHIAYARVPFIGYVGTAVPKSKTSVIQNVRPAHVP